MIDPNKSRVVLLFDHPGGFSSAGRAPALQAGGRRFDPVNLHQVQTKANSMIAKRSSSWFLFGLERSKALISCSFFNNLEEVKIVIIFVNSGASRDIGK